LHRTLEKKVERVFDPLFYLKTLKKINICGNVIGKKEAVCYNSFVSENRTVVFQKEILKRCSGADYETIIRTIRIKYETR